MTWLVLEVSERGGVWVDSEHWTEREARAVAEVKNEAAESGGLDWRYTVKRKATPRVGETV